MNPKFDLNFYSRNYPKYTEFQSYITQIHLALQTNSKKILEIGIGNKFVSDYLKKYSKLYITADFNSKLNPDKILDITRNDDFDQFKSNSFDLILICEVLEHIPFSYVKDVLKSLHRITNKYVLLSVPNQANYFHIRISKKGYENKIFFPMLLLLNLLINSINRITKLISSLHYKKIKRKRKFNFDKEHYWELGIDKYSEDSFKRLLEKYFDIVLENRLFQNPFHHFFLIRKKAK